MRRQPSIREYGAADAGSQRQDDLQSVTDNDTETLHLGIVEQACRTPQLPCEGGLQRVSAPGLHAKMRRGHDVAAAHDTRKSDRDPVEARQWRGELHERAQQYL